MSYLALYRQYRPQKFSEVIGQNHITGTLSNMIKSGRIAHAILLTGTRGTGKTSVAKIFARAVNCVSPLEDGSPCGTCAVCSVKENLDILEIDAASNNGVDEIRDLREKVKYMPVNGKYKVYIIDEVHMLSIGAFNALLKTLEEPPSNTVFILATTEVHKLPATILSRCMRFDFRLIPLEDLKNLLKNIFKSIGQKADEDAINLIASSGQGSARDTLSVADMCTNFSPDFLSYKDVLSVIGASDPAANIRFAKALLSSETGTVLTITAELMTAGKNVGVVCKDLISVLRDLCVIKTVKQPEKILIMPAAVLDALKELAANVDSTLIVYCIDCLSAIEQDLRYGLSPVIVFENALIKCCNYGASGSISGILTRLDKLEKVLAESGKECLRQG